MAQNKNNPFDDGEEYNFDKIADYESDAGSDSSSGHNDFGDSGFDPSDVSGFSGDDDAFDSKSDTFGGGDEFHASSSSDDFFSSEDGFDGPPSPDDDQFSTPDGDADSEFDDFEPTADQQNSFSNDPFADDDAPVSKTSVKSTDPFEDDDDGQDDFLNEPAPTSHSEKRKSKPASKSNATDVNASAKPKFDVKIIAGAVASVCLIGFVGYTQVLPMFQSSAPSDVVAVNDAPATSDFPSDLPGKDTNVVPETKSVDGSTLSNAVVPTDLQNSTSPNPSVVPDIKLVDSTPATSAEATGTAPSLTLPDSSNNPVPPAGVVLPEAKTPAEDAVPSTVETTSSNERMKLIEDSLATITNRLDGLEKRVADLVDSFDNQIKAPAPSANIAAPVSAPDNQSEEPVAAVSLPDSGKVTAPLKPPIIENAVLRGVSRDIAWIKTKDGVNEYKVGDSIPDAGVVESFQNYRGKWIAVTNKGIILPR